MQIVSLYKITYLSALITLFYFGTTPAYSATITTTEASNTEFSITTIAEGLEHPWGMAFLPDDRILVTERPGRLRLIKQGRLLEQAISGLPPVSNSGQGGLLDVALHPDYKKNGWIYFSYAATEDEFSFGTGTEVGRGRLVNNHIVDWQHLFKLNNKTSNGSALWLKAGL